MVAGVQEADAMRLALIKASTKPGAHWQILCTTAMSPPGDAERIALRLQRQRFGQRCTPILWVHTAGTCEDSVTYHINGLINCCESVNVDCNGFLHVGLQSSVQRHQRQFRAGRVTPSIVAHLSDHCDEERQTA